MAAVGFVMFPPRINVTIFFFPCELPFGIILAKPASFGKRRWYRCGDVSLAQLAVLVLDVDGEYSPRDI